MYIKVFRKTSGIQIGMAFKYEMLIATPGRPRVYKNRYRIDIESKPNQLCIRFNIIFKPECQRESIRHSLKREPPLPIYLGLEIHAESRSKKLVDCLFNLGMSISLVVDSRLLSR